MQFVAAHGRSCRRAARALRLSPRTLAHWKRRSLRGQLVAKSRGRPCREPTPEEREVVSAALEDVGPRLGVPTLQAHFPSASRSVLTYLVREQRRRFVASHTQETEILHWRRAGAVWAVDHSEPPRPIEGRWPQILAVRDLASGMQLAWTPVVAATADDALLVLEGLALVHGPPLVLKSDNGAAFTSETFRRWLARWGIVPLRSPVRLPRFNGACEAGIGAAKRRTEDVAARQGRYLDWTSDDLYAAQAWANETYATGGFAAGTAAGRFAARTPIDALERDRFSAIVVQYERELSDAACAQGVQMTDTLRAAYHRRAVRHVLVERGYLDIKRRSIPQPLPPKKCATIT